MRAAYVTTMTPWWESERDWWETGEPPQKARHAFAEHMNSLAKSGVPGIAEAEKHVRGQLGLLDPKRLRSHPPLTDDERAWLASLLTDLPSFDELYRSTAEHLRRRSAS